MSLQMSTALCNKLHDNAPSKTIFNLGFIKIYGGAVPAKADDAQTAAPLCVISNNATPTGLTWGPTAAGGTLQKTAAEVWSGIVAAGGGVATHFRVCAAGDTGIADVSFAQPRLQGTVGVGGTDMVMGNPGLIAAATLVLNYGALSFVPQ